MIKELTPRVRLFWIVFLALGLYKWHYFHSEPTREDSNMMRQLDTVIDGHTKQIIKHLVPRKHIVTRIVDNIRVAQTRLSCYIHRGAWAADGQSYHPDSSCFEGSPSLGHPGILQLAELFCSRVYQKRILLVGPRPFFHVQTLLLSALSKSDKKTYRQSSPENRSHYFVCTNGIDLKKEQLLNVPVNPHNGSHSEENPQKTRLLFSLSDTLYGTRDQQAKVTGSSFIDTSTGIRKYSPEWFRDLQKSHVLIINKGPLPAPAWTYTGNFGNWSFAQDVPQYLPSQPGDLAPTFAIINAALHAVFQVSLPELIQALSSITSFTRQQKIFIGSWYQQPICTNAGLSPAFQTTSLIWAQKGDSGYFQVDPWSLYYNTQVYIMDQVLPSILPYYKITYIPMTIPLISDLDGFISPTFIGTQKDCLRPASSESVGYTLQFMLLTSLVYLLQ